MVVRWWEGDGKVVDSAPACLPSLNPPGDSLPTQRLGSNYVKNRLVFFPSNTNPSQLQLHALVSCLCRLCVFYSCYPYCGDSVPDQGQIRKKKLFTSKQNAPSPLHFIRRLFFSSFKLVFVPLSVHWIPH